MKFTRWGKSKWYAWWYFAIALGFLLLAIYYFLLTGRLLTAGLRLLIAIAFAVLGYLQREMAGNRDR